MEMQRFYRKRRVAHQVTPVDPELVIKDKSVSHKALAENRNMSKKIAQEICGLSPYEKKTIDLLRKDEPKKARKFLKKRLGSMARAERKFETLMKHSK